MVPNRRLREELARAERRGRSEQNDERTIVPGEDLTRVPSGDEPFGPARLALNPDSGIIEIVTGDVAVPDERQGARVRKRVVEVETGDVIQARSIHSNEIDVSDLTDESPMPAHLPLYGDDESTRVAGPGGVVRRAEVDSDELDDAASVWDDGPDESDRNAHAFDDDSPEPQPVREEKSVVRRMFESVVAVLPKALRPAVKRDLPPVSLPGMTAPAQAKKAPPKPKEKPPTQAQLDARAWREMRTAPIFDGLPNEALRDALLSGDAKVLRLERDSLIPLDGGVGLIRGGQVALSQFSEDVLKTERKAAADRAKAGGKLDKKEKKRRTQQGPLIRLAEKNLATFEEGDVVETAVGAAEHATLACFAVTPICVVTVSRQRTELWKRIYPFMADRFRRAAATARARLEATDGAKSLVADFFIRHGLSVSMTLRVRKLDACIECMACEQACEERYGVKRLSLNGRILGGLDFVDACHTCTDARCVDPCNFDAISFDAARKEILINEANCTGCTLCAAACPYDAIDMHELDDAPALRKRLDKGGLLKFGEGAGRKARLRRIASKCDHCAFFEDQACISACPTGALIEVLPSDVVNQLPEQARATARAGFDRTAAIDVGGLNQTKAFVKGVELPELGRARGTRAKIMMGLWWAVGLAAVALGCVEILLRKVWPALSAGYWLAVHVDGIDPDLALNRVDFRPGCELAVDFGYAGTLIMISGLFYVWRRRLTFMRTWGSLRAWFDWHVMTGVVGPAFILMHSVAKLDNWISLAFWSMIGTVVSGLLGRYLMTVLPEMASTAAMETLEVDRRLAELRTAHPGVRVADGWFEGYRRRIQHWEKRLGKDKPPTFIGAVLTFLWVMKDDVLRGRRQRALHKALKAAVRGKSGRQVRRTAARTVERLALLERRRVLLPRLEPLFRHWKAVHVPMSVILTVIAAVHIALALRAG
jgi:Fe-S-cluster-containing hydrogenase component 2